MNTVSMQEWGTFMQPTTSAYDAVNRLTEPVVRGMVKLSQLNSEAFTRSVDEQNAVTTQAQASDPVESVSLQSRSIVAGGTKIVAYSAHVAEIYLTMMSEVANEWRSLYTEALRSVTPVTSSSQTIVPTVAVAAG